MLGLIDLPCQVVSAPALPPWPRTSAHIVLQFVNLHLFTTSSLSQTSPAPGLPAVGGHRNDISTAPVLLAEPLGSRR